MPSHVTPQDRPLRILLLTLESTRPASALRGELADAGHQAVDALPADLIIADALSDAGAALARIAQLTAGERLPTIMLTADQSSASMQAAVQAGVSAYIVTGREARRIEPIIRLALARFSHEQQLREALESARSKLAERKVIDRAKGVLMTSQRLSEEQAYQKLRGMAMNKNMKLADIAQRILDVEDLLG